MIVIYLAPLVMLIGLVLFFTSRTNGDLKEIGRIMFAFGLLATLLALSAHPAALRLP